MIITGIKDDKFYDWRKRKKKYINDKNYKLLLIYSGRNIGKTTNIFRAEFQESISQYKSGQEPKPIGIIMRTQNGWNRIKNRYLDNLKREPFNIPFVLEGNSIFYVKHYTKVDKQGESVEKYKRLFKLADILFLWSANTYKLSNQEDIRCLIFDEMIPEFEGYIPQEIQKFETMISTFSRLYNDKYVVGICNSITDASPYFDYIGVGTDSMPAEGETYINPDRKALLEYVPMTDHVKELQEKSTAGTIQKGGDYLKMAQGGLLKSENYFILSKPKGQYHPAYNFMIKGESFIIYKLNTYTYWITAGENENIKTYYGDRYSANKKGDPWAFNNNDWIVNDFCNKLDKECLLFKDMLTRDIILDFLLRNY